MAAQHLPRDLVRQSSGFNNSLKRKEDAQPDIFAVRNCCVVALSLFTSDMQLGALIGYI